MEPVVQLQSALSEYTISGMFFFWIVNQIVDMETHKKKKINKQEVKKVVLIGSTKLKDVCTRWNIQQSEQYYQHNRNVNISQDHITLQDKIKNNIHWRIHK